MLEGRKYRDLEFGANVKVPLLYIVKNLHCPDPMRFQIELSKDGRIWLANQTNHQWFLDIWESLLHIPNVFFFFRFCHMEPDSLSHDCTVAPTSHQALLSSGNHPCPYLCSPGSCYDNSLCLISLLFMEWHLNDHFTDQWNAPIWIKKYSKV